MKQTLRAWLVMAVLSISGGAIFMLPFLQEFFYKPLSEALEINNAQVGGLMSAFGLTALLAYFPGGWLADRVSPRKLLTCALLCTGISGLYFASFPPYAVCLVIHAFWGVTTTLLFWGAMIRVTRDWASAKDQGKAFGILESGRGVGEIMGSTSVFALFGVLGASRMALAGVIVTLSVSTILLGLLTWVIISDRTGHSRNSGEKVGPAEILLVLRMPEVWLIAVVILCSYCAMWGTVRFTSYTTDIFGLSVTMAAGISVAKVWLKPGSALAAGFVADRMGIARTVASLLAVLTLSFAVFALMPGRPGLVAAMLVNIAIASVAVSALRGIYFALLEEGRIPVAVTGTATGIISVIAYTPDIFVPVMGGHLIDNYPGPAGYRYYFLATAGICAIGLISALCIMRLNRQKHAGESTCPGLTGTTAS